MKTILIANCVAVLNLTRLHSPPSSTGSPHVFHNASIYRFPGRCRNHRSAVSRVYQSRMNCVQVVRSDFDTVLKVMFRARGETARIDIADASGRHYYDDLNLGTEFAMAIAAAKNCLKIRNQYAHCAWWNDLSGKLAFANLEDIAKGNALLVDLGSLPTYYVDIPLLTTQEDYFVYVDQLLSWVNHEGRYRAKTISSQPLPKPAQLQMPMMHLP